MIMRKNGKTRNYSIIIVSDATSTNKEFVVSSKLIKNTILAFSFLVIFFGFIIFHYLTITLDKQKMHRLERETAQKQQKIGELTSTIETLNSRLQNMVEYKHRIMVAMGLESPNALTEVGQGGPVGTDFGGAANLIPGNIPAQAAIQTTKPPAPSIQQIENSAKNTMDTLKFIESTVDQQKMRLASTPAIWPTRGYLTQAFGPRINPFTGQREFHQAIDIATQLGNPIIAPADGTVLVCEMQDPFIGNMVLIDHGFGYTTRFGHLSRFNVHEGQRVKRGDVIGFVGNSGRSTGPHLHYEVRFFDTPKNPTDFVLN
jgi:septal ring factor EnvC (AmiA/AmiB activator)